MTEDLAATPGWVDQLLDEIFANLPATGPVLSCRDRYACCLAAEKVPGAPSDMLGAEFEVCRTRLLRDLADAGLDDDVLAGLRAPLEVLEAEIAEES